MRARSTTRTRLSADQIAKSLDGGSPSLAAYVANLKRDLGPRGATKAQIALRKPAKAKQKEVAKAA